MRTTFLIFIFFLIQTSVNTLFGQARLSEDARISLLTCAPGEELYALFGHSAIRVNDPARRYDKVFNYGIFDFDTPNFLVKFVRGKLLYKLGVEDFRRFNYVYKRENRPFIEQVFNFDQNQKNKVFNYLLENAKPENRDYKYDFFFDNCSSRIRDVIQETLGDEVDLPAKNSEEKYPSYRSFLNYYLSGNNALGIPTQNPWTDFGMDLILGLPADQEANLLGQMYLPEPLAKNLSNGKINSTQPLLQNWTEKISKTYISAIPLPWYFPSPLKVFSLLFVLTTFFFFYKKNKVSKIYHGSLFILLGSCGWLFVFMWFATDHQACHQNLNMLWMNPFHLFLGIQILRDRLSEFWKKYIWVGLGLNVIVLLGWSFLPQEFHFASIPIILMSSLSFIFFIRQKTEQITDTISQRFTEKT